MPKLTAPAPRLKPFDTRKLKPIPNRADPELLTVAYRAWRAKVIKRADHQCQWVEGGRRCSRRSPDHRLFADHIIERKDGGALLDPSNGQALCGSHHTIKTTLARATRRG